jgi:hypothetical protein
MKLPTRGFFVNPDGQVIWSWEHNDPTTEFDSMPPFIEDIEGNVKVLAHPLGRVIDLDEMGLQRGDLRELMRGLHEVRVRKQIGGSWQITRVITHPETQEEVEIDHPIMDILNVRRAQIGKPLLKKLGAPFMRREKKA